ncbi:MAG TPA: nucleotide sugar dehydrogenase [Candidatus Paceibacterota bacterium]|nr:nucleotide sugar dehydrogenase [Candidatus Paceibacterota bacterium]
MDGVHRTPQSTRIDFKKIAVIGVGRVGLPLAIAASLKKMPVVGFDIDEVKIAQLESRDALFLDHDLSHAFKRAHDLKLSARESDLTDADVFCICVSTPEKEHHADMRPLQEAAAIVGRNLSEGALVIVETAVHPGVCEHIVLPIIEKESGMSRTEFFFAHVPERTLDEHSSAPSAMPRVVGALTPESLSRTLSLYGTILDADVFPMHSIKEAEAVKMVERAFLTVNTALGNELAIGFDRAGIDTVRVMQGAATKPGFVPFYPSLNTPENGTDDPYYLLRRGHENNFEHQLWGVARRINEGLPQYVVKILSDVLREKRRKIKGVTVALLGLSPLGARSEESAGVSILHALKKKGAHVQAFDPHLAGFGRDLKEALRGAHAVIIAANLPVLAHITARQLEEFGILAVVDACNCLDKASFAASPILYHGLGR